MGIRYVSHHTRKRNITAIGIIVEPDVNLSSHILECTKYVENCGVRVIHIPYNTTNEEYFNLINAIIIPNGISINRQFITFCSVVIQLSLSKYFPILGIGSSFNILISLIDNIKSRKDNNDCNIHITKSGYKSQIFKKVNRKIFQYLESNIINIGRGILLSEFIDNTILNKFYRVNIISENGLGTESDKKEKQFVLCAESREYPIFGVHQNLFGIAPDIFLGLFISKLRRKT